MCSYVKGVSASFILKGKPEVVYNMILLMTVELFTCNTDVRRVSKCRSLKLKAI